jgi:spore germination protein KA
MRKIGRKSSTSIAVCYIEDIVGPESWEEIFARLDKIDIDAVMDSNYIVEYTAEKSAFGFQTCGYTEKPDVVVARLLEGRVAILVDGTPVALTAPFLFFENFRSDEDYYMGPIYGSFTRIVRMFGFIISISCLALFVSFVAYHHEILSEMLIINIAKERMQVPFSAIFEGAAMMFVFDILREAGVRMPNQTGQALSIVGALVIGQAAVAASLVSSHIIIVVGFAGITALLVARLASASIICRYFLLILSAAFGMMGIVVGSFIIAGHLLSLKTFGVDYIYVPQVKSFQYFKDIIFRASIPSMIIRSPFSRNKYRSSLREKDV